jgi:hypothetical protein
MQERDQSDMLTIEAIITKERFTTPEEFSLFVEQYAQKKRIGCLEAMLEVCEQHDWDAASLAKSLTPTLRARIQAEANQLHLLKPKRTRRTRV